MKADAKIRNLLAAILWLAAAACLVAQVLLPGFTGLANNGDFGKIYGWLCLAPRGAPTNFVYVQPEYVWSARNYWNSPYHSSESVLGWAATRMAGAVREGAVFDIRWLGGLHAALWLAALAILLWTLRGRIALAALAPVLIFTDVCYVAYCNSFYMDAVALCGLLLMVASGVALVVSERKGFALAMFTLASLLFVTSKTQHAVWAILPAVLLWACGYRRGIARAAAVAVLLAGAFMLATTDAAYRGQALFNVIFFRLAPAGADLSTLGVRAEEARYAGMHAYMPGVPAADRAWAEAFGRRTGFARLLAWYAEHPGAALRFMDETLRKGAPEMRPENLSNFRASQGRPPGARTHRFALWSDVRAWLLRHWPWHLPLWYAVFAIGCLRSGSRLKWLALGCAALGAGEFTAAALGDALDAGRHLFLFHAATDLTVCFACAWLLQRRPAKRPSGLNPTVPRTTLGPYAFQTAAAHSSLPGTVSCAVDTHVCGVDFRDESPRAVPVALWRTAVACRTGAGESLRRCLSGRRECESDGRTDPDEPQSGGHIQRQQAGARWRHRHQPA